MWSKDNVLLFSGADTLKPDPSGKLEYFEKHCNKKDKKEL